MPDSYKSITLFRVVQDSSCMNQCYISTELANGGYSQQFCFLSPGFQNGSHPPAPESQMIDWESRWLKEAVG